MLRIAANLRKILNRKSSIIFIVSVLVVATLTLLTSNIIISSKLQTYLKEKENISKRLDDTQSELAKIQNEDQVQKNKKLEEEIKNIHDQYKKTVLLYEDIVDLKISKSKQAEIDKLFASALDNLSERKYSSASADIVKLNLLIEKENQNLAQVVPTTSGAQKQEIKESNQAPGNGFSRQSVNVNGASFSVDIIAADLNSTRVIVDTASENDCSNDCPVLSLADYVGRSGAFAGINGNYFCPASYPSCAGKTNSFDLLVMNKNKHYFNSSNNVYSNNPAVIFSGNSARFVGRALEWGRDTGVDAVLSNYPLLVSGGNAVADGGAKGTKTFVGNKGSTVYIGLVRNATVGESARVLQTLGLENALGLDQGGSTALMYNGSYLAGPGRGIPTALLFVRK